MMFLNKVGKPAHKFKTRITLRKVTEKTAPKGICYKVKIQRGSKYQKQLISHGSKRGVARFEQQETVIPMTLFFNEENKKSPYLQKLATFKLYECQQDGSHSHKIGQKEIDLSKFAQLGERQVQMNIEGSVLDLQIFVERQDDDSKSVNTYESFNDEKTNKSNKRNQKTPISDKKQTTQSRSRSPHKIKPPQSVENKKKKQGFDITQTINQVRQSDNSKVQDQFQFTPIVQQLPPLQTNNKKIQFNQGQSEELQSFILKRELKKKDQEIYQLKKQNEKLQNIIDKQIQQSLTKKDQNKNDSVKQVSALKASLTKKQIEIDRLQTKNRSIEQREKQYESTIVELRKKVGEYRNRLSETKYRQAYLMQQLFELGDKGVLQLGNKYLAK